MKKYHYLAAVFALLLCSVSCSEQEIPINHDLDNTVWVKESTYGEEIYYEKLVFMNGYVHITSFIDMGNTVQDILSRYEYTYNKREGSIFLFHPTSGKYYSSFQVRGDGTVIYGFYDRKYELKGFLTESL
jgi:hypothetical protein